MAKIKLAQMTADEFATYLERAVAEYAEEKTAAGNWSAAEALERSRADYQHLLPEGLASPGQHLYTIQDAESGAAVGMVWLSEERSWARPTAFIYDIYIEEQFRQRGYAKQALLLLEDAARAFGLETIALHVFGHNHVARALYEKLGYAITNINMAKPLTGVKPASA